MKRSLILVVVTFVFTQYLIYCAVLNRDARFNNWVKANSSDTITRVPVFIEPALYTSAELRNIREGISLLNADLAGCVLLYEFTTPSQPPGDFIWISPNMNNGSRPALCITFPGRAVNQNRIGQKLFMVPGTVGGCVSAEREVVKLLVNTLGLVDEYQRQDRPITVFPNNIDVSVQRFDIYSVHPNPGNVLLFTPGYDYQSITTYAPTKFAVNGSGLNVYAVPAGAATTNFNLARLSQSDCRAMVFQYGCSSTTTTCPDPYG